MQARRAFVPNMTPIITAHSSSIPMATRSKPSPAHPGEPAHSVKEHDMPAKSAAQQKAAGAALAAKRGDMKKSELKGASKSMEKSMSESELDKMASTKRKGKPEHKATKH